MIKNANSFQLPLYYLFIPRHTLLYLKPVIKKLKVSHMLFGHYHISLAEFS